MRIAERHIGDGNGRSACGGSASGKLRARFRYGNAGIGERRATDGGQRRQLHHQAAGDAEPVANGVEGAPLARGGALPIADVQRRGIVIARRQRGANARIHAAAEQRH